jgi:hypothetical protein
MAASAIGLATSLLPSASAKRTKATATAFSSAAFPSDQASVFYKRFKIRSQKIDSRALTASPLELLKSSPVNSEPHFSSKNFCFVTKVGFLFQFTHTHVCKYPFCVVLVCLIVHWFK